jgi:hypothetical protein
MFSTSRTEIGDGYALVPTGRRLTVEAPYGAVWTVGFNGSVVWVHGNPSRVTDPTGTSLRPLVQVMEALGEWWEVLCRVAHPEGSFKDMRVSRIDIARDFHDVRCFDDHRKALKRKRPPYARVVDSYRNNGNTDNGITVGSKSGKVKLYEKDRHTAHGDRGAVPGDMRFEIEMGEGWLVKMAGAKPSVGTLGHELLAAAAQRRWDWSGVGATLHLADLQAVRREILHQQRAGDLHWATATGMLALLLSDDVEDPPIVQSRTVKRYRKLLDGIHDGIGAGAVRLELLTGHEIRS